jgi:hypothetical protein
VIAEMFRADRRHNEIQDHLDILRTEWEKHKKAMSGYENNLILLNAARRILDRHLNSTGEGKTHKVVSANVIVHDKRLISLI